MMTFEQQGYIEMLKAIQDGAVPVLQPATSFNQKPVGVLERHRRALEAERRANAGGNLPVVCVVGKYDYEELIGALVALFGVSLVTDKSIKERKLNEVMGIMTVKSYSFDHGFFFGSEDREQEVEKPEPTLAEKLVDAVRNASNRTAGIVAIDQILNQHETEKMKDKSPK